MTSNQVIKFLNKKTMKKTEKFIPALRELTPGELSGFNGGSFAYDFGTLCRFLGIYWGYGGGALGYTEATTDWVINHIRNTE
jgi:hypothetical protein